MGPQITWLKLVKFPTQLFHASMKYQLVLIQKSTSFVAKIKQNKPTLLELQHSSLARGLFVQPFISVLSDFRLIYK